MTLPPELVAAFTTVTDLIVDNWLPLALLAVVITLGVGYLMKAGRKVR